MSEDANPVKPFDQGVPDAKNCRFCSHPRVTRNGFLVCNSHDRTDLWPIFRQPGE